MDIQTVGIVGYGHFGALVHTLLKRFAPSLVVRVYAHKKKPDGTTFFSLEEVATCGVVILAVPIHALEDALAGIVPLVGEHTIIVDVATVKVHPVKLLERLAKGKRYIATHPVWGPESYEKRGGNVMGFRIVVAAHTLPKEEYETLYSFLRRCGFDVVEVSAEDHDKHLAQSLFLTHFVGQLITRAGFERTEIDTVSFGFLMDAVESVKHDGALFQDVFRYNPYCKDVLDRVERAEKEVRSLLEDSAEVRVGSAPVRGQREALTIGISGAKGSFSEEAAREYASKNKLKKFELGYLISVENVLSALENGSIELGIFPIENSTGGVVTETIEAMARHNFRIEKMFDIEVRQNLLAQKGVKQGDIKTITSHEQALKQCKKYLKKEWPKAKIQEYEDTAKAAEDLANGKLSASTAVIASRAAADMYGLQILAESIQDLKTNATTFIAARKL